MKTEETASRKTAHHPSDRDAMKEQFRRTIDALKTLRDELRVEAHLAGMEAHEGWKKVEKRFGEAERMAAQVTGAGRDALSELLKSVEEFAQSLRKPAPPSAGSA